MIEIFQTLEDSGFSTWVRESNLGWVYDCVISAHALGMATLVGLSAAVREMKALMQAARA